MCFDAREKNELAELLLAGCFVEDAGPEAGLTSSPIIASRKWARWVTRLSLGLLMSVRYGGWISSSPEPDPIFPNCKSNLIGLVPQELIFQKFYYEIGNSLTVVICLY